MKLKKTIVFVLVALMGSGILYSCNMKQNKNNEEQSESIMPMQNNNLDEKVDDAMDQAEIKFDKFKKDIEDLSEDDPKFVDKLQKKLVEFEDHMEDYSEDVSDKNDQAAEKFNNSMEDVREQAKELQDKISDWSDKTGDNMEDLGDEIKNDFKEFKETLRDITT